MVAMVELIDVLDAIGMAVVDKAVVFRDIREHSLVQIRYVLRNQCVANGSPDFGGHGNQLIISGSICS